MATGVLVVCVGEATKLSPWLTAADKTYEATIALGAETDTLDAEGTVTERAPAERGAAGGAVRSARRRSLPPRSSEPSRASSRATLQTPPAYSAIKQDGERSYALARRGEAPELAPRPVSVLELTLLAAGVDAALPWMTVGLRVSKGYYVRSLARDLAAALGTVAHLTALRRTRSGCFAIEEAVLLDTPPEELAARVLVLDHAASPRAPGDAPQRPRGSRRALRTPGAVHGARHRAVVGGHRQRLDGPGREARRNWRAPRGRHRPRSPWVRRLAPSGRRLNRASRSRQRRRTERGSRGDFRADWHFSAVRQRVPRRSLDRRPCSRDCYFMTTTGTMTVVGIRTARLLAAATLALVGMACSGSGSSGAADDTADAAPPGEAPLAVPPVGFQLKSTPVTMAPGEEQYLCWSFVLPSTTPLNVIATVPQVSAHGVHHYAVFTKSGALPANPNGYDCKVMDATWGLVAGGGVGTAGLTFPKGTAMTLAAGTQVVLQLHLLNATGAASSPRASSTSSGRTSPT